MRKTKDCLNGLKDNKPGRVVSHMLLNRRLYRILYRPSVGSSVRPSDSWGRCCWTPIVPRSAFLADFSNYFANCLFFFHQCFCVIVFISLFFSIRHNCCLLSLCYNGLLNCCLSCCLSSFIFSMFCLIFLSESFDFVQ